MHVAGQDLTRAGRQEPMYFPFGAMGATRASGVEGPTQRIPFDTTMSPAYSTANADPNAVIACILSIGSLLKNQNEE